MSSCRSVTSKNWQHRRSGRTRMSSGRRLPCKRKRRPVRIKKSRFPLNKSSRNWTRASGDGTAMAGGAIDELAPIPMRGKGIGLHRLRVGGYRVVYRISAKRVTVLVVRIGHRSEVYRGFEDL